MIEQTWGQATRDKNRFQGDYRIILPDGSLKNVQTVAHPFVNQSGGFEFTGTSMDITQRRRDEENLRQAQLDLAHVNRVTTLGELTAALAHEVNQPIGAAVTNAESCLSWLAGDIPNLEEARAAASSIVEDGMRAAEIITRVRLMFKKNVLQRDLVDLNEVVRSIIALLRAEAMRYTISVRAEAAADLPRVTGDRVLLQQVLMNLMMNSIDAMKDVDGARQLTIKSQHAESGKVMISVSDTGVGLPATAGRADLQGVLYDQDTWDRHGAFDQPLHRRIAWRTFVGCRQRSAWRKLSPHSARRRRVTFACAEAITCRASNQPTHGWGDKNLTTPLLIRGKRAGTQCTECRMAEERAVVFVIDDDVAMRDSLQRLMRSVDLDVRSFGSAQEFLQAKRLDAPGCLVLDVRLPGESGLDLQHELAKLSLDLPIIFITGHGDIPMSVRAMKAGAVEFLSKPFRAQDLLDAIRLAIEQSRARRYEAVVMMGLQTRYDSLTPREREVLALVVTGRMN